MVLSPPLPNLTWREISVPHFYVLTSVVRIVDRARTILFMPISRIPCFSYLVSEVVSEKGETTIGPAWSTVVIFRKGVLLCSRCQNLLNSFMPVPPEVCGYSKRTGRTCALIRFTTRHHDHQDNNVVQLLQVQEEPLELPQDVGFSHLPGNKIPTHNPSVSPSPLHHWNRDCLNKGRPESLRAFSRQAACGAELRIISESPRISTAARDRAHETAPESRELLHSSGLLLQLLFISSGILLPVLRNGFVEFTSICTPLSTPLNTKEQETSVLRAVSCNVHGPAMSKLRRRESSCPFLMAPHFWENEHRHGQMERGSSTMSHIAKCKPYGSELIVEKIECSNHVLCNYDNRLRDLTKKKSVPPILRKKMNI
ncbi:hypothetical protein PR048_019767 [Dryococelus australis]|uniref:Uncharacterized protein n=1 Tax=Dryococelus australis TaxID=614101 RepID=A0ABQ9H4F0_9NEOP|nr:hypothetical protein PR048_019767 [Dryococelus australis]